MRLFARARQFKTLTHVQQVSPRATFNFRVQHHVHPAGRPSLFPQRTSLCTVTFPCQSYRSISSEQKAKDLNQQGIDDALSEFDVAVAEQQEKQVRTPWHRQGVEVPPVRRQRSAGAMVKGKLYLWNPTE